MKNEPDRVAALVGTVLVTAASWVSAQDWPQWRGPNRDDKVSGFTAPAKWPEALTQKWRTTVGAGDATPALVGDKLYVFTRQGDDETTLCLDAADGKELWRDHYGAQAVSGPASQHPGPRSSPTVADGKVITLGVGGVLSCLDASTGKVLWRQDEFPRMVPSFYTAMSPIVADGLCIAHLGGRDNAAVIAFDLASGQPKWKWTGAGPAYASPVTMTVAGVRQLVVQTQKDLIGLAIADGKLLWRVATPAQRMAQNAATPIVDGQTVFYTGQGSGTKAISLEKAGDNFTVKELWTNNKLGTTFNTPVLKDGFLFGLSDKGFLFCLNAQTGEAAWTDTTKHDRFGTTLDAGSVLLALVMPSPPANSELIAFKPSDKQFEAIAKLKVADTPTYAQPVIAGNRVFVKAKETLTLWTLE